MIVLVSLIVLLGGFPCFHNFSHGASHPYILIHSVEWFCTCSTFLWLRINAPIYAHVYMRRLVHAVL